MTLEQIIFKKIDLKKAEEIIALLKKEGIYDLIDEAFSEKDEFVENIKDYMSTLREIEDEADSASSRARSLRQELDDLL